MISVFALGIVAALASPFVLNIGFIFWQDHWKGSSFSLNLYKCTLGSLVFLILSVTIPNHTASQTTARSFPKEVFTQQAVGYIILSSFIGIVVGDWAWLRGLQLLGARRTILMDSIKPFLASLLGYLILGEKIRLAALGAIVLTMCGALLVSFENTNDDECQEINQSMVEPLPAELCMYNKHGEAALDKREVGVESDDGQRGQDIVLNSESEVVEAPSRQIGEIPGCATKEHITNIKQLDDDGLVGIEAEEQPVILEAAPPRKSARTPSEMRLGYALSILNAGLDTYGAVLTKQYGGDMTIWEINLLRFGFAAAVMLFVAACFWLNGVVTGYAQTGSGDSMDTSELSSDKRDTTWYAVSTGSMNWSDWFRVTGGVVLVTVAAPSLFNYALFRIALALTLTFTSVGPIYSLPLGYLLQNEVPTWKAGAGALLAVAGIVVLAFEGK
jgi:drug/metabolite transporter (DMT)-like permease